jgi:hypothetical protein
VADLPLLELASDSDETSAVDDPATGETVHEGSKYAIEEWLAPEYLCLGGIDR